jgi:hypothetical protein
MDPTSTPETHADPLDDDEDDDLGAPKLGMLIVAAVVALAVGGMAGFAIGFKVEQNRIKNQSKDKRDVAAARAQGAKRKAQPEGEVTQASPTSITIRTTKGKSRVINLSGSTVIDKTSGGTAADIPTGSKVIVEGKSASGGSFDATEIIVLPADTKFVRESSD